jgi:hypothetical protein
MEDISSLMNRYVRLKQKYSKRDTRMAQVLAIRQGRMSEVAPDLFPEGGPWQEPIIANMIDVAARDMAEMVGPLPSFNCSTPTMASERARTNATLKTKIVNGYAVVSDLQVQMMSGADQYVTYGFLPFKVECDYDRNMPIIRVLDPVGCYPLMDRYGRVISLFQRVMIDRDDLANQYPELAGKIRNADGMFGSTQVEVVLYHDKDMDAAFMVGASPLMLSMVPNKTGKVMVRLAQRPGATDIPRGQFDDVIFVQLAKSRFALLALQAADESVNAPLIVPTDVPEVPFGPGATIRTNNPGGVVRAPITIPTAAFAEQQNLERELQLGSRFPQTRTGNTDASIVTGRGVQALMGGYDAQVRGHQAIFSRTLEEVMSLCLEVDEKVFSGIKKKLRGSENGSSYEVEYDAGSAIKGDYTVEVKYGLMAGLDPNRWLVFALQARAEKMFSRDFMRREMPIDIDVEEEAKKIDIEDLEEAAKQAILAYAQSIPSLVLNGQDATQAVEAVAKVIEGRRKGKELADLMVEVFAPEPEPEPEAPMGMSPEEEAMAMMAGGMGGGAPEGGMAPAGPEAIGGFSGMEGGQPDLAMLLAGLDSRGNPNLAANVARRRAI